MIDLPAIDKLPEIGDRIVVIDEQGPREATVISMAECRRLDPAPWTNKHGTVWLNPEAETYGPEDTIRAWKYDNGDVSFCIMRFGGVNGPTFNKNIRKPTPCLT